jgi:peptide/nickel transport system substrate-binding protein
MEVPSVRNGGIQKGGLEYTIKLRRGVKWHDGQPFTAKDVVFSFSRQIVEPFKFTVFMTAIKGAADYKAGKVDKVTGLEALDDNTVRITLDNPYALFLNDLAEPGNVIIPEHSLKAVAPGKILSDPFVTKAPIGTGAYKFTQWVTDQYVEMDANPDYFKGKPKIDKVFMKRLLPSVAIAQLESGEVDLALRLNPLDYDRLAKVASLSVISRPGVGHVSMQYPCEQARWSDKRIRQAMAYGVDRKTIAQAVYSGRAEMLNGAPPVLDQYKDLNQYEYNPDKAKQLAQAANFDTKAPLRIIYDQVYPLSPQYIPIVGQQLQKAGFNPQLEALDSTALTDRVTKKRDTWDIRFYYGGSWATSPQIPSQYFDCKRPGWTSGYLNCDMDNLFRQAQATVDPAKRDDIYHQIARIFNEDQPMTFLWMPHDFHAASKKLGGTFLISKDAKNSFTKVEGWTLG